jgi:hypothetical protein
MLIKIARKVYGSVQYWEDYTIDELVVEINKVIGEYYPSFEDLSEEEMEQVISLIISF